MPQVVTDEGRVFDLTEVKFTRKSRSGGSRITVTLKDGESFDVGETAYNVALDLWFQAVTPASPGTYLLHPLSGEKGRFEGWIKTVVISWAVTHGGNIWPITREGVETDFGVVMHPNGEVETPKSMGIHTLREATKLEYPDFDAETDAQLIASN